MNIFESRPFKVRNAEDFELSHILDVFVNPLSMARSPFEFENSIIKGAMGSGKSMLLKANYAFHLYSIVPALLQNEPVVLPVLIRLSDFQHIREPHEVYRAVIIQVIKELANVYKTLARSEKMAEIHLGMQSLPKSAFQASRLESTLIDLVQLEADQYTETVSKELGISGKGKTNFMELGASFNKQGVQELTTKPQPGIGDVHAAYDRLLGDFNGGVLLLIDEAGSLDKSFFKAEGSTSLFETLMNQFRTAEYLRTKIAVYPHSYSDILVETRYGDMIPLTENVTDPVGYDRFRERAIGIMDRYIRSASDGQQTVLDIFGINPHPSAVGDLLEQIIYASGGNVRRLLAILDTCMQEAYADHCGHSLVNADHVNSGLRKHSATAESIHGRADLDFITTLAKTCRARSTFRFQFPYKAPVLGKYVGKSEEHNVLKISEAGTGRRGTIYEFDYAFCVRNDIPTHYIKDSEKIDKERSRRSGAWITRVAQLSEEVLEHAEITGKIEGTIEFVAEGGGMLSADDGDDYYFSKKTIIDGDQGKALIIGKRTRFYPVNTSGVNSAHAVELL